MRPMPQPHSQWTAGCRCPGCRESHNRETRLWRRRRADAALPSITRECLLTLIASGVAPATAADELGVTVQRIYARRRFDPEWDERLDEALLRGRDPEAPHGTHQAYRHHRCRCPECRAAHHPPQRS